MASDHYVPQIDCSFNSFPNCCEKFTFKLQAHLKWTISVLFYFCPTCRSVYDHFRLCGMLEEIGPRQARLMTVMRPLMISSFWTTRFMLTAERSVSEKLLCLYPADQALIVMCFGKLFFMRLVTTIRFFSKWILVKNDRLEISNIVYPKNKSSGFEIHYKNCSTIENLASKVVTYCSFSFEWNEGNWKRRFPSADQFHWNPQSIWFVWMYFQLQVKLKLRLRSTASQVNWNKLCKNFQSSPQHQLDSNRIASTRKPFSEFQLRSNITMDTRLSVTVFICQVVLAIALLVGWIFPLTSAGPVPLNMKETGGYFRMPMANLSELLKVSFCDSSMTIKTLSKTAKNFCWNDLTLVRRKEHWKVKIPFQSQKTHSALPTDSQAQAGVSTKTATKVNQTISTPIAPISGPVTLTLKAYDCSVPANLNDVSIELDVDCSSFNVSHISDPKTVRYTLIQKEEYRRFSGYVCTMTISREVNYCGHYDHQTKIMSWSKPTEPQPLSDTECRDMVKTRTFKDVHGGIHNLQINATNSFFYYSSGKDWVTESGEGKCSGATFVTPEGKLIHSSVVGMYTKITLEQVEFSSTDEEMVIASKGLKLACTYFSAECSTDTATYIWDVNEARDHCLYAEVRSFEGHEYNFEDNEGKVTTVVKATKEDGSLLYFLKGAEFFACDKTLFTTNYKGKLFLFDTQGGTSSFDRQIHPVEVRWDIFVNNRDSFLQAHISSEIEREVNQALYAICKDRLQVEGSLQYLQRQIPDLRTHMVQAGEFAVSAGETLYTFACRPAFVNPVNLADCYHELPVAFPHLANEEPRVMYLEPYTRKLKDIGIRVPCAARFTPKFKTVDGAWIMATPAIMVAPPPSGSDSLWRPVNPIDIDEIDFSQEGVYTQDDRDNMHRYMAFGQAQEALGYRLAEQVPISAYGGSVLTPLQMFPSGSFKEIIMDSFFSFLATWGAAASIFVSLCTIYGVVTKLISFLYNTFFFGKNYGCSRNLFWSFCPNFFLMNQFGERRKRKINQAIRVAEANQELGRPIAGQPGRRNNWDPESSPKLPIYHNGYPTDSDVLTTDDESEVPQRRQGSKKSVRLPPPTPSRSGFRGMLSSITRRLYPNAQLRRMRQEQEREFERDIELQEYRRKLIADVEKKKAEAAALAASIETNCMHQKDLAMLERIRKGQATEAECQEFVEAVHRVDPESEDDGGFKAAGFRSYGGKGEDSIYGRDSESEGRENLTNHLKDQDKGEKSKNTGKNTEKKRDPKDRLPSLPLSNSSSSSQLTQVTYASNAYTLNNGKKLPPSILKNNN